jgi:hypothetical protein
LELAEDFDDLEEEVLKIVEVVWIDEFVCKCDV